MANVQVFYIVGEYQGQPSNAPTIYHLGKAVALDRKPQPQVDLGKFFSRADAERHMSRFSGFDNLRIEERTESVESQHEAHRALFAPKK